MATRGQLKESLKRSERENDLLRKAMDRMTKDPGWTMSYAQVIARMREEEEKYKALIDILEFADARMPTGGE